MSNIAYKRHKAVDSWESLKRVEDEFDKRSRRGQQWAFRGQSNTDFPSTSLERHRKEFKLRGSEITDLEVKLIRDFARSFRNYGVSAAPQRGDTREWLAIMRHYRAPTRLLDFTYSFLIAAFFALQRAGEGNAAIWAVNATWVQDEFQKKVGALSPATLKRKLGAARPKARTDDELAAWLLDRLHDERRGRPFRALFMQAPRQSYVSTLNPLRLNERLAVQQGMFLAPGDVTRSFEANMSAMPGHGENVVRIVLRKGCRGDVLRRLYRSGVNNATLFPGLDGFAEGLKTKALILSQLPPEEVERLREV